ncbi:MAG: alpha-mannosidase [bacterium]
MPKKKYELHVISQTHWDREWRYSLQKTRFYLVEMLDSLLAIMESNPDYKYYHLDSQTIPLEDYLMIRPENKERIKTLVQSGRLFIGPWYTLPDQFLVSGESLIRNLMTGYKVAAEFGAPMKVGYTPFSWGQISQLPQIYAGFGIDTILFYRGVSTEQAPHSEFIWEGADGTKSLASRFSTWPRYNFWYYVYRRAMFNREPWEREYRWDTGGVPFRICDPWAGIDADYELLDQPMEYHKKKLQQWCEQLRDMQKEDFTTKYLAWMNGHDSSAPHPLEAKLIKDCDAILENDRVIHSNLPAYIAKLKSAVKDLVTIKGEMRYGYKTPSISVLYGYVTSARMYIKQMNTKTERMLQNYAEPIATFVTLVGAKYPKGFLDLSWKYLLGNHGHDSIGGCSVDKVHEDMMYRYHQSLEISQNVLYRSFQQIVKRIDTSELDKDAICLVVFNPLPFEREELITAAIDIPKTMKWNSIGIRDLAGHQEVPVQVQAIDTTYPVLQTMIDTPMMFPVKRITVHFQSGKLPACGYKVYQVILKNTVKRKFGTLTIAPNVMENEFLQVVINPNGTLNITDKQTGNIFANQHYFEDRGESGSPWVTQPPQFDQIYTSLNQTADIALIESGPLKTTYAIKLTMLLPETLNETQTARSATLKSVPITTLVTLIKGSKLVELETTLENTVEYHRLRVLFPSGVRTDTHYADGQFDVVERKIENPDDSDWNERYMREKPQNNFVVVSSPGRSLAIFNDGIKEYEVIDDQERTMALTLLRSFSLKLALLEEGGVDYREQMKGTQCLGKQVYRYAIYPHQGTWDKHRVMEEALLFNHPSRIAQCGKAMKKGTLPLEVSFISIPAQSVLSACKLAESGDGVILRLYNPTDKVINGKLQLLKPIKKAEVTDFIETVINPLPIDNAGSVRLAIGAKKIITIKLDC